MVSWFFSSIYMSQEGERLSAVLIIADRRVHSDRTLTVWKPASTVRALSPDGGMVDALASGVSDLWSWRFKSSSGHQNMVLAKNRIKPASAGFLFSGVRQAGWRIRISRRAAGSATARLAGRPWNGGRCGYVSWPVRSGRHFRTSARSGRAVDLSARSASGSRSAS